MAYGGRTIFLEGGSRLKVEDAAGKHLLNGFSVRGLCSLEYGDQEEEIARQGQERNRQFKKKMVMDHNHRNVVRKQQGLAYIEPTDYIRSAALELGLTLDEPYAQRDLERDRLLILEKENRDLKESLTEALEFIHQFRAEREALAGSRKEPPITAQGKVK